MSFFSKKKDDAYFDEISDERAFKLTENSQLRHSPNALTPNEVLEDTLPMADFAESTGALDVLKKRLSEVADKSSDKSNTPIKPAPDIKPQESEAKNEEEPKNENEPKKESLLDKCLPYILDENGKEAVNLKPIYKLQSVADILKEDSEKTIQRLSKKYEISFDDLGKFDSIYNTSKNAKEPKKEEIKPEIKKKKTEEGEKLRIKNIQSSVPFIISDIDTPEIKIEKPKNKNISNTATITFTPVKGDDNGKSHVSVSSRTRPIDLTGEIIKMPEKVSDNSDSEIELQKDEFGEYYPKEEYTEGKEGTKILRKLLIKKRRAFLQTFFSFVTTFLLALVQFSAIKEVLEINPFVGMIICTSVAGITMLINADIFLSVKKMFSKSCSADTFAMTASLLTLTFAVFSVINNAVSADILLLLSAILSIRALTKLLKASYILSNIKIIASSGKKSAVKLINDNAVTFAMAKNFIEGDVLIAAPKKVDFVDDYLRYATFGIPLGGALRVINVITLFLSAIIGVACAFYFNGLIYGFYSAAAIQCITALPMVFFLDNLPLYRASKKLNRKGAMISGKIAAQQLESANAIVVNARDIFPSGTVTLHQMKVLSENDLQDTLIRAASLTESMMSPLEPIFKKIAGTGNVVAFPDSDTVKYEDKMGISGWVDNRLLFIGNRTLMEAHGIEVPPVDIDRKILRGGYFPVYVATGDKACALLVIQYNVEPEVSRELRRLTASGVTLLVNSSDPNLTEEMLCDYLGLYDDSVKIMSVAGCHMYNTAVEPAQKISAPAAYKGNTISMAAIINCASKIKRSNILLTIVYVIALVFGIVLFAYSSLGGSGSLMGEGTLLLYGIVSTVVSFLIYLTERP